MSGNTLSIKLTADQQKHILDTTGKHVTELNINLASTGGLSDQDLDKVAGGTLNGSITNNGITGNLTGSTINLVVFKAF